LNPGRLGAAIALAIATAATPAHADSALLDRAQKAIGDIDYEAASKLVGQALDQGKLSTGDLGRAHQLAGEIAAALGDTAGARDHFVVWILLEPDAALSEGASPKLTDPFDEARQQATALGEMSIDVSVVRQDGVVRVILDARDPLNLIAGLRVEGGGEVASERGTSVELPIADGAVELTVTALDTHDDEIAVRTVTVEAVGSEAPPPVRTRKTGGWPAIIRWPTWTALAVVGLGTGGYFGWQVGKDQDELDALNASSAEHTFDEALAIEARGKRHALYADIGLGVGGAFAVAAVLTLLLEPKSGVEVLPAAGTDGAGVTASVRF
jgi:hypothetical protein